jgi:DnaD/phage-associated family protein
MLTPMIGEELQEAEKLYPADWIERAFREAVSVNKRSWKYIARILERWAVEGKDNGKLGRDSKKESESGKYVRGRYGHMVKR